MLKKIKVTDLKPGMYVANITQRGVSLHEHEREGRISDESTIRELKRRGLRELYIDTEQGEDAKEGLTTKEVDKDLDKKLTLISQKEKSDNQVAVSFEQEWEKASRLHSEALNLVTTAMNAIQFGQEVHIEPFEEMADNFIDSVFRNQNALACLSRIRDKDSYLMEHSVNVALLMSILGKHLQLERAYLHQCVTGALLHDIGKILIPDEVLHKPGKLTDEEFNTMKKHVTFSKKILQRNKRFAQASINVAAQHHERLDGRGYPKGLKGDEISSEGRMAAVVDIYDAVTADRVYHKGMTPSAALKRMLEWTDGHLDIQYVHAFIKAIGVFPVGSLVELNNHHAAIVTQENPDTLRPWVREIYNLNTDMYLPVRDLNLSDVHNRDSIVKALNPSDFGIRIRDFFDD